MWLCDGGKTTETSKNYISNADLRSEDPANKWILRAVCLLTTTD